MEQVVEMDSAEAMDVPLEKNWEEGGIEGGEREVGIESGSGAGEEEGREDVKLEEMCKNEEAKVVEENKPAMLLLTNNEAMCRVFQEDQGRESNFTDLDIICCDGFIQVHRCLLMGASEFFLNLLIDKDASDTTAITMPDVSVRHLKQVLELVYTGRSVIDSCDEVLVFETLKMMGLPVTGLLCRWAKGNNQTQVTAHEESTCSNEEKEEEEDEEIQESIDDGQTDDEEEESRATYDDIVNAEKEQLSIADTEDNADGDDKSLSSSSDEEDSQDKEEHQHQITSTTEGNESVNNLIPSALRAMTTGSLGEIVNSLYRRNTNASNSTKDNQETRVNSEDMTKDVNFNEQSNPATGNLNNDPQSRSNATTQSAVASLNFDDLNFEEACNDLQKQVAKPISNVGCNGHDGKLRKRKQSDMDDQENPKLAGEDSDDKPTIKSRRSSALEESNNRKKKKVPSPKKGKKRNGTSNTNGTNNGNEAADNSKRNDNKLKQRKSPDRDSRTTIQKITDSPSQRRLSNCSNATSDPGNGSQLPNRIFMRIDEFKGVKYKIYGFKDPVNGDMQPGKSIAVKISDDDNANHC